jgi:hypothetical protein
VTFITATLHSRLTFIAWCRMLNLFQIYQCSLVVNIHPLPLESLSLPQASAFPTEVHGVSTTKRKISNTLNLSTQFLTCLFWALEQFAFKKICTYPLLSEQTSHSQQSMMMAYESHPVPVLYCADGIRVASHPCTVMQMAYESHPVPLLYYADSISVTSCPYTL